MKKILALITVMTLVLSFASISASAYYLGDATYEDVATYINHYPIESFNFNGMSLVRVEDLESFGFNVDWIEESNMLFIYRSSILRNNDVIIPRPVFLPTENCIGKTSLEITTTDVRVVCGNYPINAYGGLDGYTLINIEDLTNIENVSVAWHPEVRALKVWVEDGLDMLYYPWELRRIDWKQEYYENCNWVDSGIDYTFSAESDEDALTLTIGAVSRADGLCVNCDGTLLISDVVDANGRSRKPYGYSYVWGANDLYDAPSFFPYFFEDTDVFLAKSLYLTTDDLTPATAWDPSGRVDFEYTCHCTGDTYYDTAYVDVLPQ